MNTAKTVEVADLTIEVKEKHLHELLYEMRYQGIDYEEIAEADQEKRIVIVRSCPIKTIYWIGLRHGKIISKLKQ